MSTKFKPKSGLILDQADCLCMQSSELERRRQVLSDQYVLCSKSHSRDTPERIYSSLPLQKIAIKKSLSSAERNSPHGEHRKRSGKMRQFCMLGRLLQRIFSICSFYEGGFGQALGYHGRQSLSVSMTMLQRFMAPRQEKQLV